MLYYDSNTGPSADGAILAPVGLLVLKTKFFNFNVPVKPVLFYTYIIVCTNT